MGVSATAPFPHGKGWGWVGFFSSRSSEPVPWPTALKIPPQVPLAIRRGRSWGERGGTTGARAAPRSGDAASRPMCQLAWRGGCSEDASRAHEARRLCGRRDTKGTEGERLARRSSRTDHFNGFSGPASGVAGDRGDDLAAAQPTERSVAREAAASSSSGRRSRAA